jgi:SAM-dependent methyltransferase
VTDELQAIAQEYAARDRDRRLRARYRLTNPGQLFLVQQRERRLLALLVRHGFAERLGAARILDIGCGSGGLLLDLLRYGARADRLAGVDLVPERVARARARLPAADLRCVSATALPYPDASFDLVCQMLVFSSLLEAATARQVAAEMRRVVRPDGLIVWYDLRRNNPRNPRVRGIGPAALAALFPGCAVEATPATLAAPLARRIAPRAWLLAELLERIPLLRTHLLAAIRPPGAGSGAAGT